MIFRGYSKKFARRNTPYYRYGQKIKLGYFANQPPLRRALVTTTLCAMVLTVALTFSTTTEGSRLPAHKPQHGRNPAVSARNKTSVTPPTGAVTPTGPTSVVGTPKPSTASKPAVIPPKPAWVQKPLYTDPMNGAAQYLAANPSVNGAGHIARMAKTPVAQWFGDWNVDVRRDVDSYASSAAATGSIPVVVVYSIPNRDCGGYSVGGANGLSIYTQWVQQVAAGIGNRPAVVVLEPDALGALDCLPASLQGERTTSIAQAVTILKSQPQTAVYIDAGTPVWQSTSTMSARLKAANIAVADGFSINVSYFASTAQNRTYGDQLSALVGYKHYVIDTSRNGGNHAVTGMQCNPAFASFGDTPTTNTGSALNDALLWIKIPWESDGPCNGSPGPGQPYWSYANLLALNAGW